jgi:hypothetical protein
VWPAHARTYIMHGHGTYGAQQHTPKPAITPQLIGCPGAGPCRASGDSLRPCAAASGRACNALCDPLFGVRHVGLDPARPRGRVLLPLCTCTSIYTCIHGGIVRALRGCVPAHVVSELVRVRTCVLMDGWKIDPCTRPCTGHSQSCDSITEDGQID